ncbi:MAG TPA: LysM peptidoglycan-binding domain-containing protein, partial [Bacteroidia bacterium]|nr:LysM peptidoglycan-binding domain-containing protein [Bacteroidia bacterium]
SSLRSSRNCPPAAQGEHINTIAKKYKCSVTEIRQWNNLTSNYLTTGQKLIIYQPASTPAPAEVKKDPPKTATVGAAKEPTKVENTNSGTATYKYYTVKKGDSLWSIAQANGTTVEELKRLNGFGSKVVLHIGDKIKIKKL